MILIRLYPLKVFIFGIKSQESKWVLFYRSGEQISSEVLSIINRSREEMSQQDFNQITVSVHPIHQATCQKAVQCT